MNTAIKERKELLGEELSRVVGILKKVYQPDKIILFGSYANGNINEYSDIDLVVIKDTKARFIDRLHAVSSIAKPHLGVNFLVYTPDEIRDMKERNHYFFVEEILKKGKLIYERA